MIGSDQFDAAFEALDAIVKDPEALTRELEAQGFDVDGVMRWAVRNVPPNISSAGAFIAGVGVAARVLRARQLEEELGL